MAKCESFLPSINEESKILILGSMPGVKSLEEQQYYAHSKNRFWKVMASVCNLPNLYELPYNNKLEILLRNNIALWDTLGFCERIGSLDSNIVNEKPNDIRSLLVKYPSIETVYLNGNKSYAVFKKYFSDLMNFYCCRKLPSTSPANARYSLESLIREWEVVKKIKI